MDKKLVSIGVVALLLAVVLIGTLHVTIQKDDNTEMSKIEGKWILYYVETATLVDEDNNHILKSSDCVVKEHYYNTLTDRRVFEIKCTGDKFFEAEFNGERLFGSFDGVQLLCQEAVRGVNPHLYHIQGYFKGDHITLSIIRKDVNTNTTNLAAYALLIPENGRPVSPMLDYVNYNIDYQYVHAHYHLMSDFTVNKDGKPSDAITRLEYVTTHSLISLFDIKSGDDIVGVQALISLGKSKSGAAMSTATGNLKIDGKVNDFIGIGSMAHGKFYMTHLDKGGDNPGYVEYQYNVPYESGNTFPTVPLYSKYEGTVKVWKNGSFNEYPITKTVYQYHSTFYAVEVVDGRTYQWFGEVAGPIINVFVNSPDAFGHMMGNLIRGGTIVMSGSILNADGSATAFLYELHPVKG